MVVKLSPENEYGLLVLRSCDVRVGSPARFEFIQLRAKKAVNGTTFWTVSFIKV